MSIASVAFPAGQGHAAAGDGRARAVAVLGVALAYFLAGRLGLELAIPPGYATAVWPPSGIALAAVLLAGRGVWPGIVIGSFLVNLGTGFDGGSPAALVSSLGVPLLIGCGAALQAVIGAALLHRFGRYPNGLAHESEVARLFILGGMVGCTVNASVSIALLAALGRIPPVNIPFNWLTWWGGDVIGVLVFTPLVLAALMQPRDIWRYRRWPVITTLTAAFAVTIAAAAYARHVEWRTLDRYIENECAELSAALSAIISTRTNVLAATQAFLSHSTDIDAAAFAAYAARLRSSVPGVSILSWAPRLRAEDRAAFQDRMREHGLAGFEVTEMGPLGRVSAGNRPEYFPVTYLEPEAGNHAALGFDLASEEQRRPALAQARDSDRLAATARTALVQGGEGVLLVLPVYRPAPLTTLDERRAALAGVVTAVIGLDDLAATAFRGHDRAEFQYWLVDETSGFAPTVLDANGEAPPGPFRLAERGLFGGQADLGAAQALDVGGRRWMLRIAPTQALLTRYRPDTMWLVLVGGLLITAMAGGFALVVSGRQGELRRTVDQRTAELKDRSRLLQRQYESLRRLNGIAATEHMSCPERLGAALVLATSHFGLTIGIFSRIDGQRYTVEHHIAPADSGLRDGDVFDLHSTYCAITVQSADVVAIPRMTRSPHAAHPCFRAFGLECYIGAPVMVRGSVYGTINFSSLAPYGRDFDEGDLEFIRLLARWSGAQLERRLADRDLRLARDAAELARARSDLLLSSAGEGICGVDAVGLITFINPAALRMLGAAERDAVGRSLHALTRHVRGDNGGPIAAADCAVSQTLADGAPRHAAGELYHHRDGTAFPVDFTVTAMTEGDRVAGAVVVFHDITIRKGLEEELRRSNRDLEQFAYVASHDLRQPLRMVNSYLTLIERRLTSLLDADTRQFIDFARDGARRMDGMIRDLLDYARVGRDGGEAEAIDLAEAVADALRNLQVAIAETNAEVTVTPGLPVISGNRSELVRLFQNLIGNALAYRAPDRPIRVTVSVRREAGDWVVSVRDNGVGIPDDQLERIFLVFQRLHGREHSEGSGIGLAVCRRIVEHHGGRIWVQSVEGEGSAFQFTLPALPAAGRRES